MLAARDERRKSEVNFEADYVSDSFMNKNTKSDVHFSKLKWNWLLLMIFRTTLIRQLLIDL